MRKLIFVVVLTTRLVVAGPIVTATNDARTLAADLLGAGLTLFGTPTLTETGSQAGIFGGTAAQTNLIGFKSGVILSSGEVADAEGNYFYQSKPSTNEGGPGSPLLSGLIGGIPTYDATLLTFQFIPTASTISFRYTFASAEYPIWVDSQYNDVFAFFVNGTNYALIPGTDTPVSINGVNGWTNAASFNKYNAFGDTLLFGGETVLLTVTAPVNANEVNDITLGIADAGDHKLDSAVFIQAGSVGSAATAPEPANFALMGAGFLSLARLFRGRRSL